MKEFCNGIGDVTGPAFLFQLAKNSFRGDTKAIQTGDILRPLVVTASGKRCTTSGTDTVPESTAETLSCLAEPLTVPMKR